MHAMLLQLDSSILTGIQEMLRNEVLDPVMVFITHLGDAGMIWILFSVLLLLPSKTRAVGIASLCALAGSYLINNLLLKNLVSRVRPYEVIDGLTALVEWQKDLSFPSGHAGSSFACAVVLSRMLPKRLGIPALVLAVLISLSRLYVGVHYPSDVLAGAFTGIVIGYAAERLVTGVRNRRREKERL